MTEKQVFISYSRPDADWARSFAEALKQRGIAVWLDQFQLAAGDSIREALEQGLRQSDVLVTLIDPKIPLQPAMFFELGAAIGMGKRVVPVVPPNIESSRLPFELRNRHFLLRESPEETAEELAQALLAA